MNTRIRFGRRSTALALGLAGTAAVAGLAPVPAGASGHRPASPWAANGSKPASNSLPAPPPAPAGRPQIPAWATDPLSTLTGGTASSLLMAPSGGSKPAVRSALRAAGYVSGAATVAPASTASAAIHLSSPGTGAWGAPGHASTLVLYDSTGAYGYLGTMYALAAGNLATHFGTVTAEPVTAYQAGQVNAFTATIYLGSTYNEPIPAAFLTDVIASTHPVIWAGDNIWQLSGSEGSSSDAAFKSLYGWDASNSYFTSSSAFNQVTYKGQNLSRYDAAGLASDLLDPYLTNPSAVTILANAEADPTVSSGYTSVPWAIRSDNLTYIGEIPFSYVNETDRVMAFESMLFDALAPTTTPTRRAMVRLEDLNAGDDQTQVRQAGALLKSQGIAFSFNVIPQYEDPNGYYNGGTPQSASLSQSPAFVKTIRDLLADGGTMVDEGYTHQYSNVPNPYDGVTADDFEFYRAQCATTNSPPYTFATGTCPNTDYVIEEGPVAEDSASWATGRIQAAKNEFAAVKLPAPTIFEFPHYAASAVDYQAASSQYRNFYERRLYFPASLTGGSVDYSYGHVLGQFFPYTVTDVYGSTIIPENLGDYEPSPINNSPVRLAADIVNEAKLNTVIPDAIASFFYDPSNGTSPLSDIISGIRGQGYSFVSPQSLLGNP